MLATVRVLAVAARAQAGGVLPPRHARALATGASVRHDDSRPASEDDCDLHMTFVLKDGSERRVPARVGQSVLTVAHHNDVDLEGACEASLACSTCHVVVDAPWYAKLPHAVDEEEDMLDLAFGLTETSRLGCQIILTKELDGLRVTLPAATRNFAVDGFVPKPH